MLILDFDGTMTDAEAEGAPFTAGYLADLSALTGRSLEEVQTLAARFEAEIAAEPQAHGWIFGGHIVAPATVDPYLRIMPIARKIFDHTGCFLNTDDRDRLLDGILYKYNYPKTAMVFRPGALEILADLIPRPMYVVTNSHTGAVQHKIRQLGAQPDGPSALELLVERVFGQAKKYMLDPDWDIVPESMDLPGLSRPLLLRRRKYFTILDRLRQQEGAEWSDVLVVGDIFELDLALPLALGARVALMVNRFTPSWELDYLRDHPRGTLIAQVAEIPPLMGW